MADLDADVRILRSATSHDVSVAALNFTTAFNTDFRLHSIGINRVGSGGNQNLTIHFDSRSGATFDIPIFVQSLSNDQKILVQFNPPLLCQKGDEINVAFPLVGGTERFLRLDIIASGA